MAGAVCYLEQTAAAPVGLLSSAARQQAPPTHPTGARWAQFKAVETCIKGFIKGVQFQRVGHGYREGVARSAGRYRGDIIRVLLDGQDVAGRSGELPDGQGVPEGHGVAGRAGSCRMSWA